MLSVKEQLEQAGSPILGTVLNMVPFDNYLGRKYYYKSYYYYDQHDGVPGNHKAEQKMMRGFTDIHAHFVYGVDDGARTPEDMYRMLDAPMRMGSRAYLPRPMRPREFTLFPRISWLKG